MRIALDAIVAIAGLVAIVKSHDPITHATVIVLAASYILMTRRG